MAGFESHRQQLEALGAKIIAASVDPIDKAEEIAATVGYPIGYGLTRAVAEQFGSFWEERRGIIQPSEFLLNAQNKVMASSYSDGPIGRIDPGDVIKVINFVEAQQQKK